MIDPTESPASNKTIGMIFDKIFPHQVRLRKDVEIDDVKDWLDARMMPPPDGHPAVDYTWRAQREIGFSDPKLAMEFKLVFG